jgi:hypothetical protein
MTIIEPNTIRKYMSTQEQNGRDTNHIRKIKHQQGFV